VPNCYYVTTSSPGQTVRDIEECVGTVGGPGRIERPPMTDGGRVHAWVKYDQLGEAMRHLNRIKRCLEEKGHVVHKHEILHDFDEVEGLLDED
jgi:hypothetical protein